MLPDLGLGQGGGGGGPLRAAPGAQCLQAHLWPSTAPGLDGCRGASASEVPGLHTPLPWALGLDFPSLQCFSGLGSEQLLTMVTNQMWNPQ